MTQIPFSINQEQLQALLALYPNVGKNSDVGKLAIGVAKLFFLFKDPNTAFVTNKNSIDLSTSINGIIENYEVKGTADKDICWNKLKVSSQCCYDNLIKGMTMIRITNIGTTEMSFYFLKHGEDFELVTEPRWAVIRKK